MLVKQDYLLRHRVQTAWTPGHFYSPIVDPSTVTEYVSRNRNLAAKDISGIDFDIRSMSQFWLQHKDFISVTPFKRLPQQGLRFHWDASPYPIGDAVTYRAIINAFRPRKIIEIGSGYSSVCALDTLDEIRHDRASLVCIEPFPQALNELILARDRGRIDGCESIVQNVPVSVFDDLERDDILFIDSTHVLKTGSDVHFELFNVLPRLKPGVLVHFHDIRWPFEYPDPFIFERNFSWNEAYALRALLMYSRRFSVFFYNSLFAVHEAKLISETFPDFMINPGSSIWIRVNED